MDNRITQILGTYKSKQSVNTDSYVNFEINNNERLLPPNEINKVLDLGEQFNYERQNCPYYRISGTINALVNNPLFNLTVTLGNQDNSWEYLNNRIFTINPNGIDLTYAESIKKNLKEIDGWYGYYDPIITNKCRFIQMEPKKERFSFGLEKTNTGFIKNWDLSLTYPYAKDDKHYLVNNGLKIIDKKQVVVGGINMTALSVPVFHNFLDGGTVRLSGTNLDGDYLVTRAGLDNGDLKEYYFCINVDYNNLIITPNSRMIKLYNNVPSEYYFRKFKKVKTKSGQNIGNNDYEIYNLPFSKNIFNDKIVQFSFNDNIDVSGLVDNLNRPLSELYLTVIKTNSDGMFTNASSGIEAPFISEFNTANLNTYLKDIPVIQKIHNVQSAPSQTFNPLESSVTINNNDFYGDVVEYNPTTVQEVVLSDVQHRFSTVNRETTSNQLVAGPRPEGYYYKAHHLIKIREFSSYIEEGDINTYNIPSYAVNLNDGRIIWRDLLDIGNTDIKIDRLDYPFINGYHYLYQNYCFNVKRQDPFDNWNLYFSNFPADPIGNTLNDKYKINISDNVC
jgi:hypothetical protein